MNSMLCHRRCLCLAFALALTLSVAAEEKDIIQQLLAKDVTVTEAGGNRTVTIKDCTKLADVDFQNIAKLTHVKALSTGMGLNDAELATLCGLTELETWSSNGMQITDAGLKPVGQLKSLKSIAVFHPGKAFTGAGLFYLTELPALEKLTIAGSNAFADPGMEMVGKLSQLKEFRTWHTSVSIEGIKSIKNLKLKSLNVGQRLAYKPPVAISDETIPILLEIATLESLQLAEARMTLAALRQLKGLTALKKLTLDGIDVAKEDVETLKKELTGVEIKWTEPNEAYLKRINGLFGQK